MDLGIVTLASTACSRRPMGPQGGIPLSIRFFMLKVVWSLHQTKGNLIAVVKIKKQTESYILFFLNCNFQKVAHYVHI